MKTYSVSKPTDAQGDAAVEMPPHAAVSSDPHAGMMLDLPKAKPADVAAAKAVDLPFDFEMPDGWTTGPLGVFRRASFFAGEGENRAHVAVTEFSAKAGPQMTSLEANLIRWRGEVGLLPVEKVEAGAAFEELNLDGLTGHYVALDGPTDQGQEDKNPRRALRVAMIPREGQIWFFKLSGQHAAVETETPAFKKFLESVHFKAAKKSPPADE